VCGYDDVFSVGAAVREPKDFVADGEAVFGGGAEGLDYAGELDAEGFGGLRGERVVAFALEEVHAVEAEGFDFDEGAGGVGGGLGGFVVDEEGGYGACAAVDVWRGVVR